MIYELVFRTLALALIVLPAAAQSGLNLHFQPTVLTAGFGDTQLSLYQPNLPAGAAARFNGTDRPLARDSNGSGRYLINLTAADLEHAGLGDVLLYDSMTQATLAASSIPIGYPVQATGVVWDQLTKRFYIATAAVSKAGRFPPNAVVAYDPERDTFGPVLNVGTALGKLALADDGSVLYAVVEGSGVIRQIDPGTLAVLGDLNFSVSTAAIAAMPGKPGTLGLCYHPKAGSSGRSAAILDNGVKRSAEAVGVGECDTVMFSPDGQYLMLGGTSFPMNTGGLMERYKVTANGISAELPAKAFAGAPVSVLNGAVYGSRGTVVDLETFQIVGSLGVGRSVAVDGPNRRILAVYYQTVDNAADYPGYLQAFDLPTLEALGTVSVDAIISMRRWAAEDGCSVGEWTECCTLRRQTAS